MNRLFVLSGLCAGLLACGHAHSQRLSSGGDDSVTQIPQSAAGTPWSFIGFGITTPADPQWFVANSTPRSGTMGRTFAASPPVGAVLVLGATSLAVEPFRARIVGAVRELEAVVVEGRYDTNQGKRVAGAIVALDMVRERPLVGTGVGATMGRFRELLDERHPELRPFVSWFPHLHNQYLQTTAETGLIGLATVFGMMVVLVIGPHPSSHARHLGLLLASSYLLGFLGDPFLHKQLPLVLFATVAGLATAPPCCVKGITEGVFLDGTSPDQLPLPVEIIATDKHPLVYADRLHAPGKPTVLCYGHYDVQPPDPLELWHTPPFEPTVRDGSVYARGSADDKGQFLANVLGVEAWLQANGSAPVNIKFLIEGVEEVTSHNLETFIKENAALLKCDQIVVSDTAQFAKGYPAICYGLRGICYMEVFVRGPKMDLHSGEYGGAVTNPVPPMSTPTARALAEFIAGSHRAPRRSAGLPVAAE